MSILHTSPLKEHAVEGVTPLSRQFLSIDNALGLMRT